jgi:hypothetical protein
MTERRKDILMLAALLLLMVAVFGKILFTTQIVRAPDILNEYFWTVKDIHLLAFTDLFKMDLSNAGWNMLVNSGYTTEGGGASLQFLKYHNLIYWLFPSPANVAWFMVLHLFFGAAGTYLYCRAIGCSRPAAFLGGLIFGYGASNATLINAGHVLKIATISYAPLAFYLLERGFQRQRLIWFLATAFTLAFQFFNYHWQIAFYTCLCMAAYSLLRFAGQLTTARDSGNYQPVKRLLLLNLSLLIFFLTTVSISLLPLANWSRETNRGVQSGANQGKGGLERDEAMSWSMPPEELATFVVPGLFGFSRQEAGDKPGNTAYYWGRMNFTQTTDYLGMLPWLLLPLVLVFRRDRYTWIAVAGVIGTLFFSMGKYTPFYNLLYDYFPGINRFRVPKMMLFMTTLCMGVIAARGVDCLRDESIRQTRVFKRYLDVLATVPVMLVFMYAWLRWGGNQWVSWLSPEIYQPTRYQDGPELVIARWQNAVREFGLAAVFAAAYIGVLFACARGWLVRRLVPLLLLLVLVADIGRVNARFLPLADVPQKSRGAITPVMEFIKRDSREYRTMPLDGDPQQYSAADIPSFFYAMPVQQTRWQEILDTFSYQTAVPDMLGLKYLVIASGQYEQEKQQFGDKFVPVFRSPDGSQIVLQNQKVLPKAWLVPSVVVVPDRNERVALLQNPAFNPEKMAIVEVTPPVQLVPPGMAGGTQDSVATKEYSNERIGLEAKVTGNALLVLSEKYYKGWSARIDGKPTDIYPVNHVLRGVYLPPGKHTIEFVFDPLPFKAGKWLTLSSMLVFALLLVREWRLRRRRTSEWQEGHDPTFVA